MRSDSSFPNFPSNARSHSHPSIIAFNPIWRIRVSNVVYPFSRSPFRYASSTLRSDLGVNKWESIIKKASTRVRDPS